MTVTPIRTPRQDPEFKLALDYVLTWVDQEICDLRGTAGDYEAIIRALVKFRRELRLIAEP